MDWESAPDRVNYGVLYEKRYPILRKAAERFLTRIPSDYPEFCEKNDYWLGDYARFMAMKHAHGGAPWQEWEALSAEEIRASLRGGDPLLEGAPVSVFPAVEGASCLCQ